MKQLYNTDLLVLLAFFSLIVGRDICSATPSARCPTMQRTLIRAASRMPPIVPASRRSLAPAMVNCEPQKRMQRRRGEN